MFVQTTCYYYQYPLLYTTHIHIASSFTLCRRPLRCVVITTVISWAMMSSSINYSRFIVELVIIACRALLRITFTAFHNHVPLKHCTPPTTQLCYFTRYTPCCNSFNYYHEGEGPQQGRYYRSSSNGFRRRWIENLPNVRNSMMCTFSS